MVLWSKGKEKEYREIRAKNVFGSMRGGLAVKICSDSSPCPALVNLYAKMGLHRYNMLNGTNLTLVCVHRYNYTTGGRAAATYYITLSAKDPHDTTLTSFQTIVDEQSYGKFSLTCFVARPGNETLTNPYEACVIPKLPEWPPLNPFQQFHLLEESDLKHNDWIHLYLKLSISTDDRRTDHELSNLKIFKVAIDTKDLNAKNATVYIHYKYPSEARFGNDVDRVAIVRRNYKDETGCFSLEGQNLSSAGLNIMMPQEKDKNQSSACIVMPEEKGKSRRAKCIRFLGVCKPWRLAFKNHGLARRLHKTRSICQSGSDD